MSNIWVNIVLIGIILVLMFFAFRYSFRKAKNGECVGCSGCSSENNDKECPSCKK